MKRKKTNADSEQEFQQGGAPGWMVTYSDLMTQLLLFFVMLFAMSTLDTEKFYNAAASLRETFAQGPFLYNSGQDVIRFSQLNNAFDSEDVLQVNNGKDEEENQSQVTEADESQENQELGEFGKSLEQKIEELDLGEYVNVVEEDGSTILRLSSVVLFDSGSAEIRESGKEVMRKLGAMLKDIGGEIIIQGHTDNRPISTVLYPTNWELSTKRATNIVLFLINECQVDPTRLTAQGNGEYRPIAPNDTEENMQKNRRIDIVVKEK